MAKKIVNIRLRPDQEERINAIVERSAILDTSKFVRIAVVQARWPASHLTKVILSSNLRAFTSVSLQHFGLTNDTTHLQIAQERAAAFVFKR
jgi:hypothetical protein